MDIVKEFIKASLKEANRSEASVAYNSNITKAERLCIIITKTLNGKITERDWNHCFIEFNLPQNYKFLVRHYSGSGKEVCGVFEKCIGRKNLICFYLFPAFSIILLIVFLVSIFHNVIKDKKN